jgi:predicted nucleic acid-binding protein
LSEVAEPLESVPPICRVPDDDWVIACAVAGNADVIVSGDRDLLALEQVGKVSILTAAQFFALLEKSQEARSGPPDAKPLG